MINKIKSILFGDNSANGKTKSQPEQAVSKEQQTKIAVCALLIELANFDGDFHEKEKALIFDLIRNRFDLKKDEADEFFDLAKEELKEQQRRANSP